MRCTGNGLWHSTEVVVVVVVVVVFFAKRLLMCWSGEMHACVVK